MHIDVLAIGPIQTNCYIVTCRESRQAAVIDPGWNDPTILETIRRRDATVARIVNTHAHWDHIGGNAALVRATGAPLCAPMGDLALLRAKGGAEFWQIPLEPSPEPQELLKGDEVIEVGTLQLKVLLTPGHTPGHVSLLEARHGAVFDGDVLFRRGIGRADLPGGDFHQLMRSIREVLFTLPDETIVYPGHGPSTTIGEEKQENPWLWD